MYILLFLNLASGSGILSRPASEGVILPAPLTVRLTPNTRKVKKNAYLVRHNTTCKLSCLVLDARRQARHLLASPSVQLTLIRGT